MNVLGVNYNFRPAFMSSKKQQPKANDSVPSGVDYSNLPDKKIWNIRMKELNEILKDPYATKVKKDNARNEIVLSELTKALKMLGNKQVADDYVQAHILDLIDVILTKEEKDKVSDEIILSDLTNALEELSNNQVTDDYKQAYILDLVEAIHNLYTPRSGYSPGSAIKAELAHKNCELNEYLRNKAAHQNNVSLHGVANPAPYGEEYTDYFTDDIENDGNGDNDDEGDIDYFVYDVENGANDDNGDARVTENAIGDEEEDIDYSLDRLISPDQDPLHSEYLRNTELPAVVKKAMDVRLTSREHKFLSYRFGLGDHECLNNKKIADKHGIAPQQVNEALKSALYKLRKSSLSSYCDIKEKYRPSNK